MKNDEDGTIERLTDTVDFYHGLVQSQDKTIQILLEKIKRLEDKYGLTGTEDALNTYNRSLEALRDFKRD